jgi:flavin reductase (DIM6/NTAB) family NADH-FMN oxidoreductase RutF
MIFRRTQNASDDRGLTRNTVTNSEASGVFCWNVATWELREAVNETAGWYADDVDEFEKAGLEKIQGTLVNAPMVARSPIRFECEYYSTLRLPGNPPMGTVDVVVGRVVGIHIDEAVLTEGKIDIGKVMPIARCGYFEYAVIRGDAIFEMIIPGDPKLLIGLEGNAKQAKEMNGEKDEKRAVAAVEQDRDGSD